MNLTGCRQFLYPALTVSVLVLSCSSAAPIAGPTQARPVAPSAQSQPVIAEWDRLVAAAKEEGTVTYYMEANPQTRTVISQEFYKNYGIKVEMVAGKGAELVPKIKMERQAGIYLADVVTTGGTSQIDLKKAGVLEPADPFLLLPEAMDPKAWPEGKLKFSDEQHTIVGLSYFYQPFIMVNTDMVKKNEISAHENFLDPKWKGKITLFDPTMGNGTTWVIWLQRTMGEDWARRFFGQLVKQDLVITRDARLHIESVARGKYPVAIAFSMSALGDLLQVGAPISPISTAEGGALTPGAGTVSVVNKPPHPNAARLLVNWLLTREGLTAFAEAAGYIPARLDITPTWVHPALLPPAGAKQFWAGEDFYTFLSDKGREVAREYFGELLR